MPFSFASHFAPDQLFDAIKLYRTQFKPSAQLQTPYVMAGVMVVAANTDEEANYLYSSVQQQFVNLRRGVNKPFPRPVDDMSPYWTDAEQAMLAHTLQFSAVGSKKTIHQKLARFIESTEIDELIISVPVHDINARLKTLEILTDSDLMQKIDHV